VIYQIRFHANVPGKQVEGHGVSRKLLL
jgi:hypothetical protein